MNEPTADVRTCLLCKQDIPADLEKCPHCVAPEPVSESFRRPDPHYDIDVANFGGLGLGIALLVLGVVVFAGLWVAGWIWPYALILCVVGGAMIPHGLKERREREEARRRLAKRRGTSTHRRRNQQRRR